MPSELYRITVDQYDRMLEVGILTTDDRVELIDGYLMTRTGQTPAHVWAVESVDEVLDSLVGDAWCSRMRGPVRIPPFDEPEPDVAVARGTRLTYCRRHPDAAEIGLVVEVSDSTYDRDRGKKWEANARSGIPAYWIVNLPKRRVEVYTDPSPEGYKSRRDYQAGDSIPIVIDGQLLGHIAVADVLVPDEPVAEANGE
jgi:Uma2 family endonuclease